MSQFEHIDNRNPETRLYGLRTAILVKAPKPKLDTFTGGAGGELPIFLTDEEEAISGDKLDWLHNLLLKSDLDPEKRETAGYFSKSQNMHIILEQLGQRDRYVLTNDIIQDSAYIGHTHASVTSNQIFPSPTDLQFSVNNSLPGYVVSRTNIIKVDSTGRISGIYNYDGSKSELKTFFKEYNISITEISEPKISEFTKPSNIESANPTINLQIEGGFLEGEGSGSGSQDIFYLLDDMNTMHPLTKVNINWQNFTSSDGVKRFPRFYEKDENGNIIKEGATLTIAFLNNDLEKPVIMGCLESLGGQNRYELNMNSDFDFANREEDSNLNEDFEIRRNVSETGSVTIAMKAKSKVKTTYRLSFENFGELPEMIIDTNGDLFLCNGENSIQLIKDRIFIGSGDYKGKAKEIGLNGERIIIGNSTFLKPTVSNTDKLFIDKGGNNQELSASSPVSQFNAEQLNNPKHQWGVNGHALVRALVEFFDLWAATKYQSGNTICQVSIEDKNKMQELRNKLPKLLNKVASFYNIPIEQEEPYTGP
jgi:hypothetical protein